MGISKERERVEDQVLYNTHPRSESGFGVEQFNGNIRKIRQIAQPPAQIHIGDEYYKALGPLYSTLLSALLPISSLFLSQLIKIN